jgi:cytochrome b6-f complex iron-sulfur subunit
MSKEYDDEEEIPNWKSDFPIRSDEATHVSRREFAKFLFLFSGGLALGNGFIFLNHYENRPHALQGEHFVCDVDDVAIGEFKQFVVEGNKGIPYILIHLEENEWRAFEQKCTHLSCAVRYRHDIGQIECPCHRGYFSANSGAVLQGPPPRPLPQLTVKVRDNKVYVAGYEEDSLV